MKTNHPSISVHSIGSHWVLQLFVCLDSMKQNVFELLISLDDVTFLDSLDL